MNWTTDANAMIGRWMDLQQQLWNSWLTVSRSVAQPQPGDTWEQTVEVWRTAVKEALAAQVSWTEFWLDSMAHDGHVQKDMPDWPEHTVDVVKMWVDTQARVAEYWLDTIKRFPPGPVSPGWNNATARKVMLDWHEASRRLLEAQFGWMQLWTIIQARRLVESQEVEP